MKNIKLSLIGLLLVMCSTAIHGQTTKKQVKRSNILETVAAAKTTELHSIVQLNEPQKIAIQEIYLDFEIQKHKLLNGPKKKGMGKGKGKHGGNKRQNLLNLEKQFDVKIKKQLSGHQKKTLVTFKNSNTAIPI